MVPLLENPENPAKLGITEHSISPGQAHHDGFYNEFISNILFNPLNLSNHALIVNKCKETLEKVAFVNLDLTSHDVIMVEVSAEKSTLGTMSTLGEVEYRKQHFFKSTQKFQNSSFQAAF